MSQQLGRVLKAALAVALAGGLLLSAPRGEAANSKAKPAKTQGKAEPAKSSAGEQTKPSAARVIELSVTADGFVPAMVKVKKGEPLKLRLTRKTDETCATELLISGTNINVPLPLDKTVDVDFTPDKAGEIRYGCAMGMMISGVLVVE